MESDKERVAIQQFPKTLKEMLSLWGKEQSISLNLSQTIIKICELFFDAQPREKKRLKGIILKRLMTKPHDPSETSILSPQTNELGQLASRYQDDEYCQEGVAAPLTYEEPQGETPIMKEESTHATLTKEDDSRPD